MILKSAARRVVTVLVLSVLIALTVFIAPHFVSKAQRTNKLSAMAPSISATDAVTFPAGGDVDSDGKADPGDTLQYTVTVNNGGPDPANGLTVNSTLQNITTLVPGSVNIGPIAANESFNAIGNVNMVIPVGKGDLLSNDGDPDGGAITMTGFGSTLVTANASAPGTTITSANGGSLTVNANGSFNYNPPRGVTTTETFFYTIADPQGVTDTAQVTITITGKIWFVNNNAGACSATCDGRLTNPYPTLEAFRAANTGTSPNPTTNDNVFIYQSATAYNLTTLFMLLNGQRVIGQGASNTIIGIAGLLSPSGLNQLPATVTNPNGTTLTTTGASTIMFQLGQNNTLRGFNIAATTGAKINGSNFGTLTLGSNLTPDLRLSGAGKAFNMSSGSFANSGLTSVETTSSPTNGISIGAVGGAISFGSTSISGVTTQGILISNATADINFGNTTVTATGSTGEGVRIDQNTSGTRTFGTLTVTNAGSNGLAITNGSTVNITGLTTITNAGGFGIHVSQAAAGTSVNFANVSNTGSANTGVSLTSNAGTVTFADLDIDTDANVRAFQATNNSGAITTTSGTFADTGTAAAVEITNATGTVPLNMQLTSVTSTGAVNGIILTNTSSTGSPGGFRILGSGGTCTSAATCTGGAIQNTTQDGIRLSTAANVVFADMFLLNSGQSWIDAASVNGLTLTRLNADLTFDHGFLGNGVTNLTVTGGTYNRGGWRDGTAGLCNLNGFNITNLLGNSTVSGGTTFTRSNTIQFRVNNTAATNFAGTPDTLTINNTSWNTHSAHPCHGDHLSVTADTGGNFRLVANNTGGANTFRTAGIAIQAGGAGAGKMDAQISGISSGGNTSGTFNANTNTASIAVVASATSNVTFNVSNNTSLGTGSVGMTFNDFTSGTFSGTVQNNTITHIAGPGTDSLQVISHGDQPGSDGDATIALLNNNITGNFQRGIRSQSAFGDGRMNLTITGNTVQGTDATSTPLRGIEVEVGGSGGGTTNQMCLDLANNKSSMANGNAGYRLFHRASYTFQLEGLTGSGTDATNITNWVINPPRSNQNNSSGAGTVLVTGAASNFTTSAGCATPALAPLVEEGAANFDDDFSFNGNLMSHQDVLKFLTGSQATSKQVSDAGHVSINVHASAGVLEPKAAQNDWSFISDAYNALSEAVVKLGEAITPTAHAQNIKVQPSKDGTQNNSPESGESLTTAPAFTLPAGESVKIVYRATVDNGPYAAGINNIDNSATVSGSNFSNVVTNTASIALDAAPDLQVVATDGGATTQPGVVAFYTLNYQNVVPGSGLIRTQGATGVAISTTVPANSTFNTAASTAGWSCADNAPSGTSCTFPVGALSAGGNGAPIFAVKVLDALPAGAVAIAPAFTIADNSANGPDLNSPDNTSNDTTNIIGNWDGSTNSDWFTPANWSNDTVPVAGQNVSIPNVANQPVLTGADVTVNNMVLNGENVTINSTRTITVNGTAVLGTNVVDGAGTLELGAAAGVTRTTGQVEATLKKNFNATGIFNFPVGTTGGQYSPVSINVTSIPGGTGSLSIKANAGTAPLTPVALNPATTLQRYWTMSGTGIVSNVTWTYLTADVAGTEANYQVIRVSNGNIAVRYPAGSNVIMNAAANTFTVNGLTSYSDWTAGEPLAPTAAMLEVSGRVLTADGRPIRNAQVAIQGDALTEPRSMMTGNLGYYHFTDLPAGSTYVVSVNSKRFVFTNPIRVVNLEDSLFDQDFIAEPQ